MYKQIIPFDTTKAGTTKYYCLRNVRLGYGVPSKYDTARQDWENNLAKHADQNLPSGVSVPVYWSWVGTLGGVRKDYGHIAVRLADGRVWTDGKYYNNIGDVSRYYLSGSQFLGWGESVNGVRVIEYIKEDNVPVKISLGTARILAEGILGRDREATHAGKGDDDLLKNHVNRELTNEYIHSLWTSAEAAAHERYQATVEGFYRAYADKIAELSARPTKAELEQLKQQLVAEQSKVQAAEKALEEAKQSSLTIEEKVAIKETNSIVKSIKLLLERIFK